MNEAQQKEGLTREQIEGLRPDELEEKQWGEVMVSCSDLHKLCDMALAALQEPKEGVTVPVEPTEEMVRAGVALGFFESSVRRVYKAMLAAHQGRDKE